MRKRIAILFVTSIFFCCVSCLFAQEDSKYESTTNDEVSIYRTILENGPGDRFTLKEFSASNSTPSYFTFSATGQFVQMKLEKSYDQIPFGSAADGDKSLHRFEGEIKYNNKFIINGTGDENNRLTFLLLKGIGYVYVRGEGEVVYPDGTTIVLPG